MRVEDDILVLDYPDKHNRKGMMRTIVQQFVLFVVFVLLSSYQNPNYRFEDKFININEDEFKIHFKNQIHVLQTLSEQTDSITDLDEYINKLIVTFYELRNYRAVWTEGHKTNSNFTVYKNLLDSINYFGFPVDYFGKEKISSLKNDFEHIKNKDYLLNQRIELELTISYSALKMMVYLNRGIIEKDTSSSFFSYLNSLPGILDHALNQHVLRNHILSVQPRLVQYQNILTSIPYFIDLHRSVKNTTPKFIDDHLLAKSLYYAGITSSPVFDSINKREDAIFKLQQQYQLPFDSILNKNTHKMLVSLLDFRYYQACLNLNRLRRLGNTSKNYLFVNIPEFKLQVVESNSIKDTFNVIVGTRWTPTPILSSTIEKVITNPYWTVPRSIVNNEMLRRIRTDSTYLKRNGYFVIDNHENIVNDSVIDWNQRDPLGTEYWLRQKNSSHNSLGRVKFVFPNNYRVYLHDTPNKTLFKRENRTFSHGCVRLENPGELAQYISDRFYNENNVNINELISRDRREEIGLSEKVEIYVQYITCTGDSNSEIIFYNDVYHLDEKEIKATFPMQSEI